MITADIICDSVSREGHRLTTFKLRYPRFIHAEAKAHRVISLDGAVVELLVPIALMDDPNLSRNASSSRAVPTAKLIEEARNPVKRATPIHWGKNRSGMQANEELDAAYQARAKARWGFAALLAAEQAEQLMELGAHKQIVNRILEPFTHINVVATATEWSNFFALRRHDDAQPEMQALAEAMWSAYCDSQPKLLLPGEWHLPFVDREMLKGESFRELPVPDDIKVSVARCARVSYESFETGKRSTVEEDLRLYARLVGAQPLHASPAEHQATPDMRTDGCPECGDRYDWVYQHQQKNFVGWRQYRAMLPNEAVTS